MNKLRAQLQIVGFCLLLGLALGHGTFVYDFFQRTAEVEHDAAQRVQNELEDGAEGYRRFVYDASRHGHLIAEMPMVKRLLVPNGGLTADDVALAFDRFADIYGRYLQVRVLDSEGVEIIRFDRPDKSKPAFRSYDLQDKSSRPYVVAARSLPRFHSYTSEISANMERGQIVVPHVPTFRSVVPVDDGEKTVGFIVLNARVGDILASVAAELLPFLSNYEVIFYVGEKQFWQLKNGQWYWDTSTSVQSWVNQQNAQLFSAEVAMRNQAPITDQIVKGAQSPFQIYDFDQRRQLHTNFVDKMYVKVSVPHAEWESHVARELEKENVGAYLTIIAFSSLVSLLVSGLVLVYVNQQKARNQRLEEAKRLAQTDHLTGVWSRAGFEEGLEALRARLGSDVRHLGICLLDVDHFKHINDTWGHATGDTVLRELAKVVKRELRDYDLLARWGGEEFVIMLEGVSSQVAKNVAERIRQAVASHVFSTELGQSVDVTISMGVTLMSKGTLDQALERADNAMYLAKTEGRNQVRLTLSQDSSKEVLNIGDTVPDYLLKTDEGEFLLSDYMGGRWLILFSHPKDYTPVCTSELAKIAQMSDVWDSLNTKPIALSLDSIEQHVGWKQDIAKVAGCAVKFPLIADTDLDLAKAFNMIPAHAVLANNWTADDVQTVRGVFILSPDKRLRLSLLYPMSIGRDFNEIVRLLKALQSQDAAQ